MAAVPYIAVFCGAVLHAFGNGRGILYARTAICPSVDHSKEMRSVESDCAKLAVYIPRAAPSRRRTPSPHDA